MKVVYLVLGFLFTGLGCIGAVLPVLPTVPFLLLASWCFAKGSKRYHDWFTATRIYQRYLKDYSEHRAMTLGVKLAIVLPVTAMLVLVMLLVGNRAMNICLGLLLLVKYWYFIFRIQTIPKGSKAGSGTGGQTITNGREN